MKPDIIRDRFLQFFQKRGHAIISSASLITPDVKGVANPTLFNIAGMKPLMSYLLGKPHPQGKRLVNSQKCLRTVDIESIGDRTHATFFEMLGNWSLGDYFKKEAINWSYEFLTSREEGLGLDPNRLYVSVFEGDDVVPRDEEAANIWREIFTKNGIEGNRIFYLPAENNWWQAGDEGPCGPDSEMYFDTRNKFSGKGITRDQFLEADANRDVIEVWNDVFMQYEKKGGKIIGKLSAPSIDTGAGLERLAMLLQNVDSIYETDLLSPIMGKISENSKSEYIKEKRIIADHIRSAVFMISDGVKCSNTERGYILRRLLRRAIRYSKVIELSIPLSEIVGTVAKIYSDVYPNIEEKKVEIKKEIDDESDKFSKTLEMGVKEFRKIAKEDISGEDAFKLFSSFGLPIDMTVDLASEMNLKVDIKGFEKEFIKHQENSRSGSEAHFKGGLADTSDMSVKYHTATHLLHQALHDVLGEGVGQKGSNINPERLRFDFSCSTKMTDEQKKRVEDIVNAKIAENLPVNQLNMSREEAEKTGARHFFGEKYGDMISIYFIGNDLSSAYSKEFCGGPHVTNTGVLGKFKIIKEESVAQGIRRIKAVLL